MAILFITICSLTVFVILASNMSRYALAYVFFLIIFTAWCLVTLDALQGVGYISLQTIRLIIALGVCSVGAYIAFLLIYLEKNAIGVMLAYLMSMILVVACLSSLVVEDVLPSQGGGVYLPVFSKWIIVVIFFVVWALFKCTQCIKEMITNQSLKYTDKMLLLGSALVVFFAPVSNAMFTIAFDTLFFVRISMTYQILVIAITALSFFSGSVFKSKVQVFRFLFYVTTFSVIVAIILLLISSLSLFSPIVKVLLFYFFGLTTIHAKKYFDKFTSNVFFQDKYDTKDVLDKLSDALINQDDISALLGDGVDIFMDVLKPSWVASYALKDGKVIASAGRGQTLDKRKARTVINMLNPEDKVIKVNSIKSSPKTKQVLDSLGIELVNMTSRNGKLNGIFMFGPKVSGAPYTQQDSELMLISGKNLAVAIENSIRFRLVERFNIQLRKEVVNATTQLRKTNEKLRSLDKTKDEFISLASHQLRTPLTTIRSATGIILSESLGPLNPKQKRVLKMADGGIERMINLVRDFLDASSLSAGTFKVTKSYCDLVGIAKAAVLEARSMAKTVGVELMLEIESKSYSVEVDEKKIKEAMLNFIDNAIKYSDPGMTVRIRLANHKGKVRLEVIDEGIGVPKDEQAALFSKSFRASNAIKARPDGNGLGLFLAKKVIDAHEGYVIFKSKPNKGSTFGFTLPLAN